MQSSCNNPSPMTNCSRLCVPAHVASPRESTACRWNSIRPTGETVRSELLLLLNHMFLDIHISRRQKHRIIVCLPKSTSPRTLEDYRPISLLTTEYKLLARILARRLRHILADQLQNSHFCGVSGNSIQDGISCVRDVLAHAEATGNPMWS